MIKGAALTVKALEAYSKRVQDDVLDLVEETTQKIYNDARQLAPSAGDPLATSYGSQPNNSDIAGALYFDIKNKGFTGEIGINNNLGELPVFIEFGCGRSAANYVPSLPEDIQAIAITYYKNGRGTLLTKPFLLPAYFNSATGFAKNLRLILQKNVK